MTVMHLTYRAQSEWENILMKALRIASFWIAAVILPGGILLLTPMAVRAVKRARARFV